MSVGKRGADPCVTICCHSCGIRILLKGGDQDGWKGVHRHPDDAESFVWFCPKDICRAAFRDTVEESKKNWGIVDEDKS